MEKYVCECMLKLEKVLWVQQNMWCGFCCVWFSWDSEWKEKTHHSQQAQHEITKMKMISTTTLTNWYAVAKQVKWLLLWNWRAGQVDAREYYYITAWLFWPTLLKIFFGVRRCEFRSRKLHCSNSLIQFCVRRDQSVHMKSTKVNSHQIVPTGSFFFNG